MPDTLVEMMPTIESLQTEAARDPQQPMRDLLHFSLELYQRRVRAQHSEVDAERLFAEIEDCVGRADAAVHSREMCLAHARFLRDKYPSLSSRFEVMMAPLATNSGPEKHTGLI